MFFLTLNNIRFWLERLSFIHPLGGCGQKPSSSSRVLILTTSVDFFPLLEGIQAQMFANQNAPKLDTEKELTL